MKRMVCLFLVALVLIGNTIAIDLYVDGKKIQTDSPPVIQNGCTLVPMRNIFEVLGATVNWDNTTRTANSSKNNTTVCLTIDSTTALVNGEKKTLAAPACIINGRTMVPVRFISEAFDANVWWESETSTVYVDSVTKTTPDQQTTTTINKPSQPATSNKTPAKETEQKSNTVYVTKTGKRYHYSSSCNGGTYTASTLQAAKTRGLTPCSKCVN